MGEDAHERTRFLDHRAPVGTLRRHAEAEITERAEKNGGVADTQAGIDDQRTPALGRISHSMMYHGLSPRVWAASTYSRVLMSIVRLRTMRKIPGPEASATAMKMLSVLGLTLRPPNGSALKTKVANSHAPARKVSASRMASCVGWAR